MSLFDIIGPVMVGPSSSHTAGAVRIGYACRRLMGEPLVKAEILLYGSFLATGTGHGTDRALVAGLLGMMPDDERIPYSLELAEEQKIEITFGMASLRDAHPNSVMLRMVGKSGRHLEVVGESIGGSRINIVSIDGLSANFSGDFPTLIVYNEDVPGCVARVTAALSQRAINIAAMQLYRAQRGGDSVMVLECDQEVPLEGIRWLEAQEGVQKVAYYSLAKEGEAE